MNQAAMRIERSVSASWSSRGRPKIRCLLEKPVRRIVWERERHISDSGSEEY